MSKSMLKLGAAVAAVLAFAACAADSKPGPGISGNQLPSASSSSSESASASGAPTGQPAALSVTAAEPAPNTYSFDTAGVQSVPAGLVAVKLSNSGTQTHQVQLVKVTDGDFDAYKTALVAQGAAGVAALGENDGGPNAVDPGGSASATSLVTPGTYALVCFIPGAPDGKAHAQHGMVTKLEVTPPPSTQALPAGDQEISAQEFGYIVPANFSGTGTFSFKNTGKQAHELAIFKLGQGATQADLVTYFSGQPSGPPPATSVGGIAGVDPGTTQNFDLKLAKGTYVFMCFLPDTSSDFQEHFKHGMITTVTVS